MVMETSNVYDSANHKSNKDLGIPTLTQYSLKYRNRLRDLGISPIILNVIFSSLYSVIWSTNAFTSKFKKRKIDRDTNVI